MSPRSRPTEETTTSVVAAFAALAGCVEDFVEREPGSAVRRVEVLESIDRRARDLRFRAEGLTRSNA